MADGFFFFDIDLVGCLGKTLRSVRVEVRSSMEALTVISRECAEELRECEGVVAGVERPDLSLSDVSTSSTPLLSAIMSSVYASGGADVEAAGFNGLIIIQGG